jgi:hypothetical protein
LPQHVFMLSRLDGSNARIFETAATRAYRAGQLAILSTVTAVPVKALPPVWTTEDLRPPRTERTHPDPADVLWWSGFVLTAAGVATQPCRDWQRDVQEAFRAGSIVRAHRPPGPSAPPRRGVGRLAEEWAEVGVRAPIES